MRRAKSFLYRRTGNIARETPERMFPPVDQSAIDSLVQAISEIYKQRVSGIRQATGSESVEGPSAPVRAQSINTVTRSQREAWPVPSNPSERSLVSSQILEGDGAWENMLRRDVSFSLHVNSPPSPRRNSNRSLSLRSCRDSNRSLSIRSCTISKRSLSLRSRRLRNFSLSTPSRRNSNSSLGVRSSRSSRWKFPGYIAKDLQPPSPRLTDFYLQKEIYETTKRSLEQTSPTAQVISNDDNSVAGAPAMQLENYPKKAQENLNDEITDTAATAMQLVEQPSKVQEDENNVRELQRHARTYLSRGEHAQACILYGQMSVLLHKQRSSQSKFSASDSTAELVFEVEHQLAMRTLRQGELDVAREIFERLREDHTCLTLPDTIRWSLDHWLSIVYIELGLYNRAIVLTKDIPRSIGSQISAGTPSYLEQLPEHQATWLVFHAQALSCLARVYEGKTNKAYEEIEELFTLYDKSVDGNIEQSHGTNVNPCDDQKRPTQVEQSLRFILTVVQVRMLAERRRAAKMLIDDKNSEDCARVLGKTHPLSIESLIVKIQLLLPAADRACDEKFQELQDAMQYGYARLHPLTLSVCELQLAISLKQGRLTEAMNATEDLISRIDDAHLGKNHFRSLQARRWRVRVLFERGEVTAALSDSEQLINACQSERFASQMHSTALACVVDSIFMHLRLRHYGTAETALLNFFVDLQGSRLMGIHTPGPDIKPLFDMASEDVVLYLLGLPEIDESKTPVDQAFATCYITALQCLYICYLEREALSSDILHKLATYVLERRRHQSIGSGEDLEALMLLYNLAVTERELQDFDKALEHLQEAQTGFVNSLGHNHPHTLLVDFELRLVKLLRHRHEHVSGTEKRLIEIKSEGTPSSEHDGETVDSVDVLDLIRLQKTALIRLDNSLGGSHIFTITARIDLANVLEEFDNTQDLEHLHLEIMWYLLPYKGTPFRETPALPFTASELKPKFWSQERAERLRDTLQRKFVDIISETDGTVESIDKRFLSVIASLAYNKHASGYYMEAITAQHAYVALCKCSGVDSIELAEARLELGYMHQSCADACSDSTIRSQQYMRAMKIYKDILRTKETNTGPLGNAARSFLGAIYFRQGKFELAQDEQEKVYRALKEPQTDDIYMLLDSIYNLALTEESLDNNDRALSLWYEGRDISSRKLGFDDEQTKLFDNKLKDWDVSLRRPSSATGLQHGNQRDSVMAASPKRSAR
jgi:tetratricopeptide (TPR) repeat protein